MYGEQLTEERLSRRYRAIPVASPRARRNRGLGAEQGLPHVSAVEIRAGVDRFDPLAGIHGHLRVGCLHDSPRTVRQKHGAGPEERELSVAP